MPDQTQVIGIVAGIFTGVSLLPQLIKIIKEKKSEDISWFMLFILLAGLAGWVWYGILKEDYPIIITNSFSFLVNLAIIFFHDPFPKKITSHNLRRIHVLLIRYFIHILFQFNKSEVWKYFYL